jgi:phospholipase/carboxylesterase
VSGIDAVAHRLRPAAGEPRGAIVLLHGRGTDEHDLAPLIDVLDPERAFVGVTPRGPLPLPPGGNHWYAVHRIGFPDRDTFRPTYELLAQWLDALPDALGVPWERTLLGGFSQGAVMSYALGLGAGRPSPAAILALSGFMPTVEGFALDLDDRNGYPVAIGHGTLDPVIDVAFARDARDRLLAAGADVVYRETPMGHSVDPEFLVQLRSWVGRLVAAEGADSVQRRPAAS